MSQPEAGSHCPVQHVSDSKVEYKWLKGGIEFVEVIPKNPSGKIVSALQALLTSTSHCICFVVEKSAQGYDEKPEGAPS